MEIHEYLKGEDAVAPKTVAERFMLSRVSVLFLVSRLAEKDKFGIRVGQTE